MSATALIRPAAAADGAAIAEIYNHYVLKTIVTFEEEAVAAEEMARRVEETLKDYPWLAAVEDGRVVGYSYAGRWKTRCSYRHSLESTVYLAPDAVGRGLGRRLYSALLERLRPLSAHAVIGGISLPNAASVALHESLGFKKVAHFPEVGRKFERWIDVGYWQLTLA